jgi:hypothetical protein
MTLFDRLSEEDGGFEIASSMALAAFAIVAAAVIFLALQGVGEEIVQYMRDEIMGGL